MKYLRIKKQADFTRIFNKGKRGFSASLTVAYRPSERTGMAVSVGKRHGKSVQSNRIKRLLREAFRSAQTELKGTYSFILVPKVLENYSVKEFERDLKCIFKKENL